MDKIKAAPDEKEVIEVPLLKNNAGLNLGEAISANRGNPYIGSQLAKNLPWPLKSLVLSFLIILLLAIPFSLIESWFPAIIVLIAASFFLISSFLSGFLLKGIAKGAVAGLVPAFFVTISIFDSPGNQFLAMFLWLLCIAAGAGGALLGKRFK